MVINLDPHDKPGSHWVALYFDLKKMEIYYFDSYGIYPPKEVENLMFRLKEQGKDLKKKISPETLLEEKKTEEVKKISVEEKDKKISGGGGFPNFLPLLAGLAGLAAAFAIAPKVFAIN